jgi:hypothetical protein
MTVADDIVDEVRRKSGHTEADLAALIFGRQNAYQQRVNSTCRKLVADGVLVRHGNGGSSDPYRYSLNVRRGRRV